MTAPPEPACQKPSAGAAAPPAWAAMTLAAAEINRLIISTPSFGYMSAP
jgi:hypothetical protein